MAAIALVAKAPDSHRPMTDTELELRARFVEAMSGCAASVNVITTDGEFGRFGITVSACNSVSADPPTVLVCINRRSPACAAVLKNGVFAVSVLNQAQEHVSDTFPSRPGTGAPFDFSCCEWDMGELRVPFLKDAVAAFECAVEAAHDIGSHIVFVGRVVAVSASARKPPAYGRRSTGQLRVVHAMGNPASEVGRGST